VLSSINRGCYDPYIMNIADQLKEHINMVVKEEYGLSDVDFAVEHPQNKGFGDYASNVALILSKQLKQNPSEIAKRIGYGVESLTKSEGSLNTNQTMLSEVTIVAPGFINFKLNPYWALNILSQLVDQKNNYGVKPIAVQKRIALEHSNVNPNKAIHVGHLRNACIGQFIERVYEHLGYSVEVQYYANNVGVQVATSMMGIDRIKDLSPTDYKKYDHFAWDVYARMESLIDQSPTLQKERQDILAKLDDPQSAESIKQRTVASKILIEQLRSFAQLDFDYDVIIYESDVLAKKLWERAFERLKNNPNVYLATEGPSQGCWLVKLDSQQQDVEGIETDKIIVRSNGVPTYTGKDIGYHMWKFGLLGIDFDYDKWTVDTQTKDLWVTTYEKTSDTDISFSNVDFVYNVVGVEQTYAMDVVKQSLAFLGYEKESQNMKHINYGFVFVSKNTAEQLGIDTSDGKKFYAMSGRKGWGVKVDDLIDMIDQKLKANYGDFAELAKVRTAAIKFQMLKINTYQDLIFDLDEALDLKGYSGPYLQYAYVRAKAVLLKADVASTKSDAPLEEKEVELIKLLDQFPEAIELSAQMFAPNMLCDYLFELAKTFNIFYNDLSILNAATPEIKSNRLFMCQSFASVMEKGLWLLGISTVSKM
jgi:arginyl-tRNA synthetase